MTRPWRYALWFVLPGLLILMLMWANEYVTDAYHVQRVTPFVLMSLAKIVLIAVLIMQHPGPPAHVPRWKAWRYVDPLTAMLIAMLFASALYFVLLWGGNSQQFQAPEWGYTTARLLMGADGYLLLTVGMEMLYRAAQSRIRNRTERTTRYDITDGRDQKGG